MWFVRILPFDEDRTVDAEQDNGVIAPNAGNNLAAPIDER